MGLTSFLVHCYDLRKNSLESVQTHCRHKPRITKLSELRYSRTPGISYLLKTGSLDNAIREFSLAWPSWVRSPYIVLYKYGKRTRDFLGRFLFSLSLFFYNLDAFLIKPFSTRTCWNETIIANS